MNERIKTVQNQSSAAKEDERSHMKKRKRTYGTIRKHNLRASIKEARCRERNSEKPQEYPKEGGR